MAKKGKDIMEDLLSRNIPAHYVRQPIEFTLLKQNLSLNQINFLVELVDAVQDKIKVALSRGKGTDNSYPELFTAEDLNANGRIPIDIRFSSLNTVASRYQEIEDAISCLQEMKLIYNDVNEKGENVTKYQVLFPSIEVPYNKAEVWDSVDEHGNVKEGKRRQGIIKIEMMRDTANAFFSLKQHTQFLKAVTSTCKSQYTSRLYMCISTHKDDIANGCVWRVTYNDLRRILGVTEYFNKSGAEYKDAHGKTIYNQEELSKADVEEITPMGIWVRTKYQGYGQFKKCILERVAKELHTMCDKELIDCYFTMEDLVEILPNGVKRGTPHTLVFHIHKTPLAGLIREKNAEFKMQSDFKRRFTMELDMTNSMAAELSVLINADNIIHVEEAISRVHTEINSNKKIKNIGLYSYKAIKNAIADAAPIAEEVPALEEPIDVANTLDKSYIDTFQCIKEEFLSADWKEVLSLEEVADNVVVGMPTQTSHETFMKYEERASEFFEAVKEAFEKDVVVKFMN